MRPLKITIPYQMTILTLAIASAHASAQSLEQVFHSIVDPIRELVDDQETSRQSRPAPRASNPRLEKNNLNGSFNIRSRPSVQGHKITTVQKAVDRIQLTGNTKTSKDGSRWLEVRGRHGLHGWVNDRALNPTKPHAADHAEPFKKPKSEQRAIKSAVAKSGPQAPTSSKESLAGARSLNAPVHAGTIHTSEVSTKTAQAEPKPKIEKPKTENPALAKTEEKKVVANSNDEKQTKPEPKHERECASSLAEFRKAPMLKEALGDNYNAWSRWDGTMGTTIVPNGRGMLIAIPEMGKFFGYSDTPITMEICVEAKDMRHPYAVILGKKHRFNDPNGNSLTLNDNGRSSTFSRAGR